MVLEGSWLLGTFSAGPRCWRNPRTSAARGLSSSPKTGEARVRVAGRLPDRFFELFEGLGGRSDRIRGCGEIGALATR